MRLIFMGTPSFVVPVLEALAAMPGVDIIGIVTPPDRPAGRGRQSEPPPVKLFALEHQMAVLQPASLRPEASQDALAALAPDVIVVAAYGKLLPPAVLALPPHGCLNLHPSLLPRHRGPTPVPTAILEGDEISGVTLMLLDQGMDTGPVVAQAEHPLIGAETTNELTEALFTLGTELLVDNLEPWVQGRLSASPQDESRATMTRKLERGDGLADWSLSAEDLERRSQAFTPWPGLFSHWDGKVLKLTEVSWLRSKPSPDAVPGQVVTTSDEETPLAVVTANGLLGLKRVQLEGHRQVTAREFLSGFPAFTGTILAMLT